MRITRPPAPMPSTKTASSNSGQVGATAAVSSPTPNRVVPTARRGPSRHRAWVNPIDNSPMTSPMKFAVTTRPATLTLSVKPVRDVRDRRSIRCDHDAEKHEHGEASDGDCPSWSVSFPHPGARYGRRPDGCLEGRALVIIRSLSGALEDGLCVDLASTGMASDSTIHLDGAAVTGRVRSRCADTDSR